MMEESDCAKRDGVASYIRLDYMRQKRSIVADRICSRNGGKVLFFIVIFLSLGFYSFSVV